ncbi:plasmid partitioning protein RepB C-terminal domain-containing protein [Hydrogenophaga sp.]|uniref:plasmid partitioning protein RepB C-terminal domain-containing protein n=1 Tax=Hydrogenophaga sp. TaxID=1904254 RepID=UPI00271B285B|nr:plasmid partitioning protein RepB C-terminal domain-containing protein [Hydrogenophaga sp.]MDO9433975.1 plasmid partitioning protein RepB C-terminal domain-containing protein [Hydrogenophaga sp.]
MRVVSLGFLPKVIEVKLDNILLTKKFSVTLNCTPKYRQVIASLRSVGLIEPLIVTSLDRACGKHLLLDGHLRLSAMRELGADSVACLISTDDEAYTYNKRVNRISTIQEHVMIRRAVERGVSPQRLAIALAVDISMIVSKLGLLEGICSEALHVLRDREFAPGVTTALRKMKPTRQIECAEIMVSANSTTVRYARALLAATPDDMLKAAKKLKRLISEEQISQIERETANLRSRYRIIEQTYGDDVLNVVVARGYVSKLVANVAVENYLAKWHGELLPELRSLISLNSIDD